ncbi:MAG: type II secretion system F family protein [Victivallaceae bacterium]|nr:type II secretion system F family protein [Victivallaceae bacterium]
MATYVYTALDTAGKELKGKIQATTEDMAAVELRKRGLFPTTVRSELKDKLAKRTKNKTAAESRGAMNLSLGPNKIKRKDLMVVTRQLATLLEAGLPLIRSLRTLERQNKRMNVKRVLGNVADSVEEGATFSEALTKHPRTFDKLYLNMVKAGEAAGAMETILSRLAFFMEKNARIIGKIKSAMIYPIAVLIIAGGIMVFLMVAIVPKFRDIFRDLTPGQGLPALTETVIDISNYLQHNLPTMAIMLVSLIVFVKIANRTKYGKFGFDFLKYRMPLFGPIVSKGSISRFARTLGTLMSAGVPVLTALNIVRDTSGNEVVANAVQKVHDAVKEGEGIAAPLSVTNVFPQMVISMIEVGEETGRLPDMLEKIADTYDEEVDNAVNALTSLIEPLLIIVMGGMVGVIVIAMFLPLISLVDKLSG